MMHTRAERKMSPYRQPARGAAARSASLEMIYNKQIAINEAETIPRYDILDSHLHFVERLI